MPPETPATLLVRVLTTDPARPLVTQYEPGGERIELSAATLHNWVSKTANLLQAAGLGPGTTAAVLLPPHWQAVAVMLGCWSTGIAIAHGVRGAAPERADVAFAGPDRLAEALALGADEVWAVSLTPLGGPLATVPAGAADYAADVRGQADRFTPATPVDPDGPALIGALGPNGAPGSVSLTELVDAGRRRAAEIGIDPGDRLLVVASSTSRPRPMDWLVAPLAAGASVVLLRDPDPATIDARATAERVTVRLPG